MSSYLNEILSRSLVPVAGAACKRIRARQGKEEVIKMEEKTAYLYIINVMHNEDGFACVGGVVRL